MQTSDHTDCVLVSLMITLACVLAFVVSIFLLVSIFGAT